MTNKEHDLGAQSATAVESAGNVQDGQLPHAVPLSMDQEVKALKRIAQQIDRMSPDGRRAAIYWLADFYLGIKWWGLRSR